MKYLVWLIIDQKFVARLLPIDTQEKRQLLFEKAIGVAGILPISATEEQIKEKTKDLSGKFSEYTLFVTEQTLTKEQVEKYSDIPPPSLN